MQRHRNTDGGNFPFFSICTEVTNREKTIRRTIESIARQTYRNFEYIIINNQSDDQSDAVIKQTLLDVPFRDIHVQYSTTDRKLSDIESWNAPIKFAKGRYVVMCEGDDWFAPDHLENAARVLGANGNIGLYVAARGDISIDGQSEKYKGIQNCVPYNILTRRLLNFTFAPPPSEAIFLRLGKNGPFLYNAERYVYAAEYGLYFDILRQGFNGYLNVSSRTVFRGPSSYMRRLFHIRDAYTILEQWRFQYESDGAYREARMKLLRRAIAILAVQTARMSIEAILVVHIFKEALTLRTFLPLWVFPQSVMVCIRQDFGILWARVRS